MRRRWIILFSVLLFTLSACTERFVASPTQAPAATPSATLSPTPTPAESSVIAVFGAEGAEAFLEGIQSAAKAEGDKVEIIPVIGGVDALASYPAEKADAAIVFLTDSPETLPKTSIPTYVFAAEGQGVSVDIPHLTFTDATVPKLALDCALSYPPHLAPVRMIGLFSSQSSPAYLLWSKEKASGTVFAKEEFFQDVSEVSLTEWLNETLPLYYPGMLDAIYAETGALAIAAADVLAGLGRDDIEVFSAGTDADAIAKLSNILVCAVGANDSDAGARCYSEAIKFLSGGMAQNGVLLPETSWYSENP